MRGKWLLISGTAILIAGAAGVLSTWRRTPPKAPPKVAAPAPALALGDRSYAGMVRAEHIASVGPAVSGTVEALLVDVGAEVFEGQLLARISNQGLETGREVAVTGVQTTERRIHQLEAELTAARLEASRAQAEASRMRDELNQAEKAYKRQAFLFGQGATPRQVYQKAVREFEQAKEDFKGVDLAASSADDQVTSIDNQIGQLKKILDDKNKILEEAKARLDSAEVRAPVNGMVVVRIGEVGQPAPSENENEMFRIATDSVALQVVVEPPPPELSQMKPGMAALVFLADLGGEGISGSVAEIQPDGKVVVNFICPSGIFKPGLTAQVKIRLGSV